MATINENSLRRRLKYEWLIGRYVDNGLNSYFCSIRGGEGEKHDELERITIPYSDNSLIDGEFYSFDWHVTNNNPLTIEITGNIRPIDKVEFLDRFYQIESTKSGGALTQSIANQKMMFQEVTGAEYTYIYELLQNANDYPYKDEAVKVRFILTPHYLFFMHTGAEFNLLNIVGICSVAQGDKKDNVNAIGYKGIGFKTVFVNNNYIYLKTGDWSFRFDELTATDERHMNGECAWAIMPIPTKEKELDNEVKEVINNSDSDFRVRFAMRNRDGDASFNRPFMDKVFKDNRIILFIPNVNDVEVIDNGKQVYHVTKDQSHWVIKDWKYEISPALREWVANDIKANGRTPKKFLDIKNIRISFAIQHEGKKLIAVKDARVYNYLPTEVNLCLPFLINADFIPDVDRLGLHNIEWNWTVLTQCGRYFVDWWALFTKNEGEYDLNSVFDILPNNFLVDKFSQCFKTGYQERILEISAFPVLANGEYSVHPLSEIINDKTGIMNAANAVFTDEEFYKFSNMKGYLPHPNIRSNKALLCLFENYPENCLQFKSTNLEDFCGNKDFNEWLKVKENNIKFLKFLIDNRWIQNFSNRSIFLNVEGSLSKASDLYKPLSPTQMDDLSFLSDMLPRMNQEVFESLNNNCSEWDSFVKQNYKSFNEHQFVQKVLSQLNVLLERLTMKDNNIHFVHFLSLMNGKIMLPNDFPFIDKEGKIIYHSDYLYLWSEEAESFLKESWVDPEWIQFLHKDYQNQDPKKIEDFFQYNLSVEVFTKSLGYKYFVENSLYIKRISEIIKNKKQNRDFYLFMSSLNYKCKFSDLMRTSYTLPTTDLHNQYWTPVGRVIFYHSDEWEKMALCSWIPKGICQALDKDYFDGLTEEQTISLKDFFRENQFIQNYRIEGLKSTILSKEVLPCIFQNLSSKESSKDYLNFLFENRKTLFGEEVPGKDFKNIPIGCRDRKDLISINAAQCIYMPSEDLEELYMQSWFNKEGIYLCDSFYEDLFSGNDRILFFKSLGFGTFELKSYITKHVIPWLKANLEVLKDREVNLEFHHYFCSIHEMFTEAEMEPLQDMPIYISSPENEEGELVMSSCDHYLPSELLTNIVKKDLVPISILDSIHPDYLASESDKKFYKEKLGNVEIDLDSFISYISSEENIANVSEYLKDKDRNIRFWRWAASAISTKEQKSCLTNFPILCKDSENEFLLPKDLYLADEYNKGVGIESLTLNFVPNAKFVSPLFMIEGDTYDWRAFFKSLSVTTNNRKIVFGHVIEHLDDYKEAIVPLLAQFVETFDPLIKYGYKKVVEQLKELWLYCKDGHYRKVQQCLVSGRYFDIDVEPLPQVLIPNMIDEKYLDEAEGNNELYRQIKRFIILLADTFNIKVENATELRNLKIEYFCNNQDTYDKNDHFNIIGYIANAYAKDPVGIIDILDRERMPEIKFYSQKEQLSQAEELRLSSVYKPECDFMSNGITELSFVSEKYADYSKDMKRFLMDRHIAGYFKKEDLKYLNKEPFARYFWNQYAPKHKDRLSDYLTTDRISNIPCLPTALGVKAPCELYDYRITVLKNMVMDLPPSVAEQRMTTIVLPEWLKDTNIGMRDNLTVLDCLQYLSLETTKHRRDAMTWLIEAGDETLTAYRKEIKDFAEQATWLNGEKKWKPLRDLVAIEWGNETMSNYFSSNPNVCSISYMPEYKQDYDKLCEILSIHVLSNNDFKKQKVNPQTDDTAFAEIKKRLLYLAYKSNSEDWKEIYNDYCKKLDAVDISKCEDILYYYSDRINTSLVDFTDEHDKLWYVGNWNGPSFQSILNWLIRELNLKFELGFLKNVFVKNFKKTLQSYDYDFPQDFLDALPEEDRKGLQIAEDILSEQEDDQDSTSHDNPYASDVPSDIDSDDDLSNNISDTVNQVKTEKTQSAQPKEKNQNPSKSQPANEPKDKSERSDSKQEEAPERKSVEERVKEEWEQRRKQETPKPHPKRTAHFEPESIPQDADSRPEERDKSFGQGGEYKEQRRVQDPAAKAKRNIRSKTTAAQNNADQAQDTLDLFELLNRTPKYSYLWFEYLMKLLFSEQEKAYQPSIDVTFNVIERKNATVFSLRQPSHILPKWLEYAASISVTVRGTKDFSFEPEVMFVLDDELAINVDSLDEAYRKSLVEAEYVVLHAKGNSANHVRSLCDRFLQLNFDESYNLRDNLPKNIKYIYGPAGTGKTTEVVRQILSKLTPMDRNVNVLVLAPTNKAADVIADRYLEIDSAKRYKNNLYRFGTVDKQELIELEVATPTNSPFITYDHHHVVVTTMARFAYNYLQRDADKDPVAICDFNWDYIFIDEASMIDIVSMAYVLFKAKPKEFIIAGDPMQIRPITQNDIDPENIYDMAGINSFARAIEQSNVQALKTQFRSIQTIGSMVSNFAYDGQLLSQRQDIDSKPLQLGIPDMKHINLMGFRTDSFDLIYGLDAINDSAFHLHSVIFAYRFADYIARKIHDLYPQAVFGKGQPGWAKGTERYSIGIVSPYGAQANSIKNMLENRPLDNPQCRVTCGTVHRFQGDQCDIMLVVLNPPSVASEGTHVNNLNLVNVALSRARDYVFIITPQNEVPGFKMVRNISSLIPPEEKSILYCSDIEKLLWGDSNFIYHNTNVALHTPTNVFYNPHKIYEVRKDDTAVDIQINEEFDPFAE